MRRLDDCRTYYQPNSHRVRSTLPRAISRAPPAQPTCAMKVLTSGAHSAETLDTHPRRVRSRPLQTMWKRASSGPFESVHRRPSGAADHHDRFFDAIAAGHLDAGPSTQALPK